MLKFAVLSVLVALCTAQNKGTALFAPLHSGGNQYHPAALAPSSDFDYRPTAALATPSGMDILPALPMEVSQQVSSDVAVTNLASETMQYSAPSLAVDAPTIHLPKGSQEVVDIPHAAMPMPGNSIQNKDLHLNLPSPTIEAPNPIIRKKDVLFRVPQPIFYVPNPIVQHKPIVYRVPHTLRTITPRVNLQSYLFKVPSAQITGKSGYSA